MTTMTDEALKTHAYECGFYGTTFFHLDQLTDEQRELWDAYFEEGRSDERDELWDASFEEGHVTR